MRRRMSPEPRSLIFAVAVLAAWGCPGGSVSKDSTAIRPDSGGQQRRGFASAAIIAEGDSLYNYGPERPQVTVLDPDFPGPHVDDDSLPHMFMATATLKDSTHKPSGRIIARIRSEHAYPQAGIDSGYNYVWRNTWRSDAATASSWQTLIISHDTTRKSYALTRDPRKKEYTHGAAREPRLVRVKVHSVGFGACFDDPSCPTGHCGYF